jgi:multisubunit Na+/H+ antiporter MnhB subunit
MKPPASPTQPARQSAAKFMKRVIFVCWGFMAAGAIALAVAGHLSPGALATLTGAIACVGGAFVVLFQGAEKWAHDPEY